MHEQEMLAIKAHSNKASWFDEEYRKTSPYSDCFTYSRHRLSQALAGIVPQPGPGARLLDVGCGTGEQMRHYANLGYTVTGIDGSDEMLKIARSNNPAVELRHSGVGSIPFDADTFDLLLCIEVLRYLPDIRPCVAEMARVTRPGGVCIATAQPYLNANGYWVVNRIANKIQPKDVSSLKQFFCWPSKMARDFRKAGFRDVQISSIYTGPVNWWERIARTGISGILRRWEPIDAAISRAGITKPFANMIAVRAAK